MFSEGRLTALSNRGAGPRSPRLGVAGADQTVQHAGALEELELLRAAVPGVCSKLCATGE